MLTCRLRHHHRHLVLVVLAMLLAGCRIDVVSHITVTGPDTANISVVATFSGAAHDALDNPDTEQKLRDVVRRRFGDDPTIERTDTTTTATVTSTYGQMQNQTGLLGISDITLQPTGTPDVGTLSATLQRPGELVAAITDDTNPALTQAMLGVTQIGVQVTFPGGITDVQTSGVADSQVQRTSTSAQVRVPIGDMHDGQPVVVQVTGQYDKPLPWLPIAAGIAAVVAVGVAAARFGGRRDAVNTSAAR